MLSKADLEKRSHGIGSSEIAMLIYVEDEHGDLKPLSPWGGKHKLWRKKTGKEEEKPAKTYMSRGNYMEAPIIQWYADDHGVDWKKPQTMRHPSYPYVVDSADALTYPKGQIGIVNPLRCIEAKALTGWNMEGWGEEGTDEIPDYYITQGTWHIGAHKPQEMLCDFPIDTQGQRKDYSVQWDEEFYLALVSEAERFWKDYVETDKEPPVDDYSDATSWLTKYLKQKKGMGMLEADEEHVKLLLQYREMALQVKEGEGMLEELKEKIMRAIGEYDGIVVPGSKQKITWKQAKDTMGVGWRDVADTLAKDLKPGEYQKIQDAHQRVTRKGSRRWTPTALLKNKS
jgi:predicted phage-related endonuclease